MAKYWAALLIITSFLMLAPIIESGTSESTQFFQAIGTAHADYAKRSLKEGAVFFEKLAAAKSLEEAARHLTVAREVQGVGHEGTVARP